VPSAVEASVRSPSIFTQFAADEGLWDRSRPLDGASITFGVSDPAAEDGREVALVFPGDPALSSADDVGPDVSTEISTKEFVRFGTMRARVRFPACSASEEVVSAAFAFSNDGTDANGDGLDDNPEIDFQVLCGTPSYIVLTVWTDYERSGAIERFVKTSRAVDTTNGALYALASPSVHDYVPDGAAPELAIPDFPDPGAFYEIGFEWQPASVRFFIERGGAEVTLWTLTAPALVPQVPLQLMFNLWHPETHWLPGRTEADYPAADAELRLDRFSYTPL
jgi:hypothetical protein